MSQIFAITITVTIWNHSPPPSMSKLVALCFTLPFVAHVKLQSVLEGQWLKIIWNEIPYIISTHALSIKKQTQKIPIAKAMGLKITMLEHLGVISHKGALSHHLSSKAICQDTDSIIISSHMKIHNRCRYSINYRGRQSKEKGWQKSYRG